MQPIEHSSDLFRPVALSQQYTSLYVFMWFLVVSRWSKKLDFSSRVRVAERGGLFGMYSLLMKGGHFFS